jgi:CDP-diacylglycerol---serine O-phosphatidyltransferase
MNEKLRKRERVVRTVPSWFTLGNAICGFTAIICAASLTKGVLWSSGLIMLAMVCDAFDGRVARKMGTTSSIGAQLDSLSDAVSFGIAPAFVFYQLFAQGLSHSFLWLVSVLYLGCAVVRLARFNTETTDASEEAHRWFSGLPSTMAALVVCAGVWLSYASGWFATLFGVAPAIVEPALAYAISATTAAASLLMVSRIRFPHINGIIYLLRRGK